MVIFYNVLPCINCFDEGGVGDNKNEKGFCSTKTFCCKKKLLSKVTLACPERTELAGGTFGSEFLLY